MHRDPEGPGPQGPRVALGRARGAGWSTWPAPRRPSTRRAAACARRSPPGPGSSSFRRGDRAAGRRPARLRRPRRCCPGPRRRSSCAPSATGAWRGIAARAVGHAGDAARRRPRDRRRHASTPPWASCFHKKVGDPVAVGEPIVTVHAGRRPRGARPRSPGSREAIVVAPEAPPPGPARPRRPRLTRPRRPPDRPCPAPRRRDRPPRPPAQAGLDLSLAERATGLLGLAVILGLAWLMSYDRRRIPWRLVGAGLAPAGRLRGARAQDDARALVLRGGGRRRERPAVLQRRGRALHLRQPGRQHGAGGHARPGRRPRHDGGARGQHRRRCSPSGCCRPSSSSPP